MTQFVNRFKSGFLGEIAQNKGSRAGDMTRRRHAGLKELAGPVSLLDHLRRVRHPLLRGL